MELLNDFFVSYSIERGPKIFYIASCQVGRIIFHPSRRNVFVKDEGSAFLFDNDQVDFSENLNKFIIYTGFCETDFQKLCWSLWNEDFGSQSLGIYCNGKKF